jgi:hypothetical protein
MSGLLAFSVVFNSYREMIELGSHKLIVKNL